MADTHNIQSWLNGDKLGRKLRKELPLIGLLVLLSFVYICIGYNSIRQQHRLTDTKKEMLDAKYRYLTISAQLTNTTQLSQIATVLQKQGSDLKENTKPPTKILN